MHLARSETFQKDKLYGLEHTKIEMMNRYKWNGQIVQLKNLIVNFNNSILDNSNWDKVSQGIITKSISGTECDSL